MRILGLVLMIVGIAFEILLALALLGGGKNLFWGFIFAGGLIAGGWKLRSYGKGIRQEEPVAAPAEATPKSPPPQSPTAELPITQDVSFALVRQRARWRRTTAIIIACGLVFFLVLAEGIPLAVSTPTRHEPFSFLIASFGLFLGLFFAAVHVFQRELPVRRDLRDATYLRTSGPVQVVSVLGGWLLRLADRAFFVYRPWLKVLLNLRWATVDYSRHAHVIFEIRDSAGQVVYSAIRAIE